MEAESPIWEVLIPVEKFEQIKSDSEFLEIVTLARITNALQFCLHVLIQSNEDLSNIGHRQRFNAFLYTAATLHEGIDTLKRLCRTLRLRKSFQTGFKVFFRDKDIRRVRREVLRPLRNQHVFHFEHPELSRVLITLRLPRYVFQSSKDDKIGSVFFNLADDVVLNWITGDLGDPKREEMVFRSVIKDVMKASRGFILSAHELIGEVVLEKGAVVVNHAVENSP